MRVKREIYLRVTGAARHILATGATVRQCAERCRLRDIDPGLFAEVSAVLEKNRRERHLRGGMATRRKYEQKRAGEISS